MPPFGRRSFLAAGAVLTTGLAGCSRAIPETYDDGPGWGWTRQARPLDLGVTHVEYSLAPTDPPEALARGRAVLAGAGRWQNQHLMGWGALDPEPAPGADDWSSLDPRFSLIATTGGRAVLTVAGAPDWMKGAPPGTTDFARLEEAPLPRHYDDLAALAARAVARYPQVAAVLVWNEFKGFYDEARGGWDAAGYTDLYERVAAAVKRARPEVLVGGPYVPMDLWASGDVAPSDLRGPWGVTDGRALAAVEYWLANHTVADLVVVDGGTATRDRGQVTDPVTAASRFAATTSWLRERTDLPVWWAEFYPEPDRSDGADDPAGAPRAAATLAAVAALARGGASVALLWGPQSAAGFPYAALWTDSADPGGGRGTALAPAWSWLVPRLAAGAVETGRSPDGRVLGLRADDGVLLVNTADDPVEIAGTTLGAFAAAVVGR